MWHVCLAFSTTLALVVTPPAANRVPRRVRTSLERPDTESLLNLPPSLSDTSPKVPTDFDLNRGRVFDALRRDIPEFMNRELDWDVYAPDVQLVDPSGVEIEGLDKYQRIHSSLRLVRQLALNDWTIRFQIRYDWCQRSVVVQWYSRWYLKTSSAPLHVDAVSYFDLNDDGLISRHRIDRAIINSRHVMAPAHDLATLVLHRWGRHQPAPVLACDA